MNAPLPNPKSTTASDKRQQLDANMAVGNQSHLPCHVAPPDPPFLMRHRPRLDIEQSCEGCTVGRDVMYAVPSTKIHLTSIVLPAPSPAAPPAAVLHAVTGGHSSQLPEVSDRKRRAKWRLICLYVHHAYRSGLGHSAQPMRVSGTGVVDDCVQSMDTRENHRCWSTSPSGCG